MLDLHAWISVRNHRSSCARSSTAVSAASKQASSSSSRYDPDEPERVSSLACHLTPACAIPGATAGSLVRASASPRRHAGGATHPIPLPRTGGASPFRSKSRTAGATLPLLGRVALPQTRQNAAGSWKRCASGRDHRPHPSHPSAASRRDPDRFSGMMCSAHESRMFERNWPRREPLRLFPVCLGLFVCRGDGGGARRAI